MAEKDKKQSINPWLIALSGLVVLLLLLGLYIGYNAKDWWGAGAMAIDGQLGDYFNGMLGPFIALASVITTFAAFFVQYQANESQKKALSEQGTAIKDQQRQVMVDRFEQRFFEMLKIHRENAEGFEIDVSELSEKNLVKGKKAFRIAAQEVEVTMALLVQLQPRFSFLNGKSKDELLGIAFLFVYWGVDSTIEGSKSKVRYSFSEDVSAEDLELLMKLTRIYKGISCITIYMVQLGIIKELRINPSPLQYYVMPNSYQLWRGHHHDWSHYIRQMLRMFEMLDDAVQNKVLDPQDTARFARILRSQLSNDEQKLIYYYSQSNIGKVLWEAGYMTNYIPFKNINIEEIPAGIDPRSAVKAYLIQKGLPATDQDLIQYFDYLTDYV